jgi:hypothetical protein
MNNDIWIQITFNSKEHYKGKDKLIEELRQVCVVQERKLWYPAADSGSEFIVEILINSPLAQFIQNVVVAGLAWDALKFGCTKVWDAFSKFVKKNGYIDLQTLSLTFNDATIIVNGILGDNYGFLVKLFKCLPKHWAKMQEIGLKDIIEIELPLLPCESSEKENYYIDYENQTPENCLWSIRYELGLEICHYNPKMMKIVWPTICEN